MRFEDKVVVVTGSTQGLGRAMAVRFAAEGAHVIVCGRNQSAGEAVVESILGDGGSARFVRVDVSVEDEVRRLVAEAVSGCGGIDVLVNNAMAIDFIGAGGERPIVDQPTESFDYIVKVGLYGTFWATKYAIPAMLEGGGGAIVNISSIASVAGMAGVPSYSVVKGAINALTRQVAVDYGPQGLRCNVVVAGFVPTGGLAGALAADPEIGRKWDEPLLTRRGRPEDVAAAVTFLSSEEAAFINGIELLIDGGLSAKANAPDFTALLGALSPQ
jgi:meso-butanediol dehydrogenase / (S,S)-butanediol dehydrogenase / diacetyl reductase